MDWSIVHKSVQSVRPNFTYWNNQLLFLFLLFLLVENYRFLFFLLYAMFCVSAMCQLVVWHSRFVILVMGLFARAVRPTSCLLVQYSDSVALGSDTETSIFKELNFNTITRFRQQKKGRVLIGTRKIRLNFMSFFGRGRECCFYTDWCVHKMAVSVVGSAAKRIGHTGHAWH